MKLELLLTIGLVILVIFGFSVHPALGLVFLVGTLYYLYYKRRASISFLKATQAYTAGDKKKAMACFKKSYSQGMTDEQKVTYAYCLLREGMVEESERLFLELSAFSLPYELKCMVKANYAVLLLKTGRAKEAQKELEDIFPEYKNTTVYGTLGYLYIVNGDLDKAKEINHEGHEYNHEDGVIIDNLVQLYDKLENYEKAYYYVEKLMKRNPQFIEAYYDSAKVCIALGKYEEAKDYLQHAKTIEPSFISDVTQEDVAALLNTLA